jgi:hypothetical protein
MTPLCWSQQTGKQTQLVHVIYLIMATCCDLMWSFAGLLVTKNHVVDYRITSQILAHKTEARQRTCADWPSKCWKCLLQRGQPVICLLQYLCTSDLWGASYGTPVQRRALLLANKLRKKYTQENNAIWGYQAARIFAFLLTFLENLKIPPKVVPKLRYQIITTRFVIIHKRAVFIYFAYKACNHAKYIQFQKSNYDFQPNNIFV